MHPDAETRIFLLAQPLEEPDRSAFIRAAASEAVEKLGANAYGPGALHHLLAPLGHQRIFPSAFRDQPHEPKPGLSPRRQRRGAGGDKLARELPRRPKRSGGSGTGAQANRWICQIAN